MPRPIAISLSPNTERDDVLVALRQLLQPQRWRQVDSVRQEKVERALAEKVGQPHAILVNSGRAAITRLLHAAGIGKGDEVILQAFTCLVVPNAIRHAGATPVYADIDPATYNLDPADVARKITPATRALIMQHTFGIPAAVDKILAVARQHTLLVIEDCAHAFGGTHAGQPLGSAADAAILSFGRDKVISSVFGGAIAVRDDQLVKRIRQQEQQRPLPPRWWVGQQLLHPLLLWYVVLPLYFIGSIGKIKLVAAQKLRLLSRAVAPEEYKGHPPIFHDWRYPPALLPLLEQQLTKLPRFSERRREIVQRYHAAFPHALPPAAANQPLLRFPVQVNQQLPLLLAAYRQRMLLDDWYGAPVIPEVPTHISGYTPGSCPQAEQAAQHIVNLPTYPRLTDQQVDRVVAFIKAKMENVQ